MNGFARIGLLVGVTLLLAACGSRDGDDLAGLDEFSFPDPWPVNIDAVLATVFSDAIGDQELLPPDQDGPPYSGPVPFPAVDVSEIPVGVEGDFLYMRVDFAGPIPAAPVHIVASGEVEEQWVRNQGMNIALNVDGDAGTGGGGEGVSGIDIFFAVGFDYQRGVNLVYANWDFPDGDLHHNLQQMDGELGQGGPGHAFALVRYDVSGLGSFFPRGGTVDIGSWSEAESYNADGSLKYHHFAFDRVIDGGSWTIPAP